MYIPVLERRNGTIVPSINFNQRLCSQLKLIGANVESSFSFLQTHYLGLTGPNSTSLINSGVDSSFVIFLAPAFFFWGIWMSLLTNSRS